MVLVFNVKKYLQQKKIALRATKSMALLNDDDPKAMAKKQQKIPSVSGNFFSKYKEITKGQLILKCLFGIFNSPKKRT